MIGRSHSPVRAHQLWSDDIAKPKPYSYILTQALQNNTAVFSSRDKTSHHIRTDKNSTSPWRYLDQTDILVNS